jgi:hypothetical protein
VLCARRFGQGEQGLARRWCAQAKHRRRSHGNGTTPTTCARQWDRDRWTASGGVRTTEVCAHTTPGLRKARPWLDGGMHNVWVPAANRSSTTHVDTKERHDRKAKERARRRRQRHLQSDRLGSMATAGLLGGAVRDSGPRTAQKKPWAWPSFLCSARRPNSTARRETRRSPRVQRCGGEAVLKSSGKMDAEQGTVADWLEQRKQRLVWLLPSTNGSGFRVNGSSGTLCGPRMAPPSSGSLACRPDGDLVVQRRDGFGLPQCDFRFSSLPASPSPPLLLSPCGGQGEIPKGGGRFWEMRLGTGICKASLGFPGTEAGGWDPSASAHLATW